MPAEVPVSSESVEQGESAKFVDFEDKEAQEEKIKINKGDEISRSNMKEQNIAENEDSEAKNREFNKIRENIISTTRESSFLSFCSFFFQPPVRLVPKKYYISDFMHFYGLRSIFDCSGYPTVDDCVFSPFPSLCLASSLNQPNYILT